MKKKVRAAAVVAVATTAVTKAREYAKEYPEQATATLDSVERLLRARVPAKHATYLDKGSVALRKGLGLPAQDLPSAAPASPAPPTADVPASPPEDPDPDTAEPWTPHDPSDPGPLAPNPAPGTRDDPQPRRREEDPAPLTPGEHPRG